MQSRWSGAKSDASPGSVYRQKNADCDFVIVVTVCSKSFAQSEDASLVPLMDVGPAASRRYPKIS